MPLAGLSWSPGSSLARLRMTGRTVKSAAAKLGSKGGKARAVQLTKQRRTEIAKSAASARWSKVRHPQD
jgi:hypothetical protein